MPFEALEGSCVAQVDTYAEARMAIPFWVEVPALFAVVAVMLACELGAPAASDLV